VQSRVLPLNAAAALQYKERSGRAPHARGRAMGKSERERRHQANLDRINRVQLVCGSGDRLRIDHEGTMFERARML
jgi:hypothetical protein